MKIVCGACLRRTLAVVDDSGRWLRVVDRPDVDGSQHATPDSIGRTYRWRCLEAVGHVVVAWVWLEQLVALGGRDDDFARGKRVAADWFLRHDLPRTGPQFALLESLDRTVLDARPEWL